MTEPEEATLTDEEISTHQVTESGAVLSHDTGDDTGDTSDTGDDAGDSGDDSGDSGDVSDTGDDSAG